MTGAPWRKCDAPAELDDVRHHRRQRGWPHGVAGLTGGEFRVRTGDPDGLGNYRQPRSRRAAMAGVSVV
jgi:hypothetical protein